MRKLVSLVCVAATLLITGPVTAGVIPSWESPSKTIGFYPISNQVSLYQNYDDSGEDRGRTLQVTPGLDRDHYVELSLVKPVTPFVSLNVQRVISTFEPESINQFGVRLVF
jgi:hypothetical protein